MSNLQQAFAHGKAFIPFITAGDPSLEITEQLVLQMAAAGADLIELGIPFSDPVAEGSVIQKADQRALAAGTTTDKIFAMIRNIRRTCSIPLALMTYINPVFVFGSDRFMKQCKEVGVQAVIVPDLPFEEKDELLPYCSKYGIHLISMIAPTSRDRINMIVDGAEGFVYCVSSLGVTGVRNELKSDVQEMIQMVRDIKSIPCAIGFGINTPDQTAQMAQYADGVIVGSAIMEIIEQHGFQCVPYVADYVRMMKQAVMQAAV